MVSVKKFRKLLFIKCNNHLTMDNYLEKVGGKLILHCQFDTRKLPNSLPVFL